MSESGHLSGIKAVLFDFGGVLAELRGEAHLLSLMKNRITKEEVWAQWSASPAVRAHETGTISAEQFSRMVVAELALPVAPLEFLTGFRNWIVGPFAESRALIQEVALRHTTALVSNTSAVHWPAIESTGVLAHMHHVFASYQIGRIKPDHAYFEFVLEQMRLTPREAVFLDDGAHNIDSARELGLHAYRVESAAAARRQLTAIGVLTKN